ncbi:MAG: transglycosylase SLT domain-containing protein [Acidobacteria bacterium]|nr:transglycosylase SLT domain-containing protein [Acidobacteriota bacterium]
MIWLLALLWPLEASLAAALPDPRIEWVELQHSGKLEEALDRVEEFLASQAGNGVGPKLGAHYFQGRLLTALGRGTQATSALAAGLGADPKLEPWTRYRLAEVQIAHGHPEVAAGLLATLLGSRSSTELENHAARLLATALRDGGDCRLLANLDAWSLKTAHRRPLRLERAECRHGRDPDASYRELVALLAEGTADSVAFAAAGRLAARVEEPPPEVALDIAMAFFGQRSFEPALEYFTRALQPGALPLALRTDYELLYAVARSYFWLRDYRQAAERFDNLATLTQDRGERARAYYQQARSLALADDGDAADRAYDRAYAAEIDGSWAAAALTARVRIAWLAGRENDALTLYRQLGGRRRWHATRARTALFLAASDLVQGRADRAGDWLTTAAATTGIHPPEVFYWRGRLAEAREDLPRAVQRYRSALLDDAWDPWSQEARERLGSPTLAAETKRSASALAASNRERDLLSAWLLAPASGPGMAARDNLRARLRARGLERAFMELATVPTPLWPLWESPLTSVEGRLLALGDWQLGLPAVARYFPVTEARLGLTRSRLLAEAGLTRASILTAELLAKRAPATVPPGLWPAELTRNLYPLAYGKHIRREAAGAGLDPLLLAALIREESRFDAAANSAAAAYGLTQFVLPTARRLGRRLGLEDLGTDDLQRPEIAIRLGAFYLAELGELFARQEHSMLAAYNAGEPQTELWQRYCFSDERAEFLTKVGFRETRGYLRKVLRSYARYRELYPGLAGPPTVATTPGKVSSISSK